MITPSTRVFGLITADREDGWLARLFNYLFGFNGLDAAYVTFFVRPDALVTTLDGLAKSAKAEAVHVAPSHWAAAAAWYGASELFDELELSGGRLVPCFARRFEGARAAVVASSWSLVPPRAHAQSDSTWPMPSLWVERAQAEIHARFGHEPRLPDDIEAAIREPKLRPCKMTDDLYMEHYAALQHAR